MVFDQLAKNVVVSMLARAGVVHTEVEIAPSPVRIDAVFARGDVSMLAECGALGAVGARVEGRLLIEAVSRAVSQSQFRACVNRQHAHYQVACAEARRQRRSPPPLSHLCIVSAGRPKAVMRAYELRQRSGLPRGFYQRSPGDALSLVVVSELPCTRETLLLRLMGRGAVLRGALKDAAMLPEGAYERTVVIEVVRKMVGGGREMWQFEGREAGMDGSCGFVEEEDDDDDDDDMPAEGTPEEWEAIRTFLRTVVTTEQVQAAVREEALHKGRREGREAAKVEEQGRLRASILALYHERFGAPPEHVVNTVHAVGDQASLIAMLTLVASCPVYNVHKAVGLGVG